jgi:8-oxo-dGTP pyrophosphatase MutT (NUDIX family)
MHKEIHPIQANLLKNLLLSESARFSVLKPEEVPSDQFTFHLKQLSELGVVEKTEEGMYRLTHSGKEYANRFDIDSGVVKTERQAKLSVIVLVFREKDGVRDYVMQERLKHPFFGYRGFIAGKIKIGESIHEAATRELKEETGMEGSVTHKSVYHERIYSMNGDLLEDKYFFVCTAEITSGDLQTEFEGGRNAWIHESEVLNGHIFYDVEDLLALVKDGAPVFSEHSYTVDTY